MILIVSKLDFWFESKFFITHAYFLLGQFSYLLGYVWINM